MLSGGVGKLRGFKKRFLALSLTRLNKTKLFPICSADHTHPVTALGS